MRRIALLVLLLIGPIAFCQTISYFNQGFLRQPTAAADRTYLGITNSGGGGTNFYYTNTYVTNLYYSNSFTTNITVTNPPPTGWLTNFDTRAWTNDSSLTINGSGQSIFGNDGNFQFVGSPFGGNVTKITGNLTSGSPYNSTLGLSWSGNSQALNLFSSPIGANAEVDFISAAGAHSTVEFKPLGVVSIGPSLVFSGRAYGDGFGITNIPASGIASGSFVQLSGDTMTGPLQFNGDPSTMTGAGISGSVTNMYIGNASIHGPFQTNILVNLDDYGTLNFWFRHNLSATPGPTIDRQGIHMRNGQFSGDGTGLTNVAASSVSGTLTNSTTGNAATATIASGGWPTTWNVTAILTPGAFVTNGMSVPVTLSNTVSVYNGQLIVSNSPSQPASLIITSALGGTVINGGYMSISASNSTQTAPTFLVDPTNHLVTIGRKSGTSGDSDTLKIQDRTGASVSISGATIGAFGISGNLTVDATASQSGIDVGASTKSFRAGYFTNIYSGNTSITNGFNYIKTNPAPSNVTIGITAPDAWVWFTNGGTAFGWPSWKNH